MKLVGATLEAILAVLTGAGGPFEAAAVWLGVAESIVDNGQATTLSDVTAATGAVATRTEITDWTQPFVLVDGRWAANGTAGTFRPASSAQSQTISAWYLADALAAGNLVAYGFFNGPIALPDENYAVQIVPRLTIDPDGRWSANVVING